jgi:hypothetical protein
MGEKAPKEAKPNRVFRGAVIRAAIQEALEYGQGLFRPLDPTRYVSGDWDEIGVGAMMPEDLDGNRE